MLVILFLIICLVIIIATLTIKSFRKDVDNGSNDSKDSVKYRYSEVNLPSKSRGETRDHYASYEWF